MNDLYNGMINVYKEKGYTSFDVVALMRGIAGQRKVGHAGTLDPNAEGVLPICLGNATRLCDMLTDKQKEYIATFTLGIRTDTLDMTGEILEKRDVVADQNSICEAAASFVGGYNQIPPMFSAKQIDGHRLYDIARAGRDIERKPVWVDISEIEILSVDIPTVRMRVVCGKGTYIRSLCEDIAAKCNDIAVMTDLVRTRVCDFTIETAHTLKQLEAIKNDAGLGGYVVNTDEFLNFYPAVTVLPEFRKLVDNCNPLKKTMLCEKAWFNDKDKVRVYNDAKEFVGVYEFSKSRYGFYPYKIFPREQE